MLLLAINNFYRFAAALAMAQNYYLRYNRSHANKNSGRLAGKKSSRRRKHLCDDRRARDDAGHPSAKNRGGQSYAHKVHDGDAAFAPFVQHAASG